MAQASHTVYTVGHSTRSADALIDLLKAYGVKMLVDVRTVPRSRTNPQFNLDTLPKTLKRAGIGYVHLSGLGGLRKAHKDSINSAWRNKSFQGYADHLGTEEFEASFNKLVELARMMPVALMCAEAVWWRCHRSLIADVLVARKIPVRHIMSLTSAPPHHLREWAVAKRGRVTYPATKAAS